MNPAFDAEMKTFLTRMQEHDPSTSLRIFVVRDEGGYSKGESYGTGNFHAMIGYVQEWLDIQRERNLMEVRRREGSG